MDWINMANSYSQRCLIVLCLQGVLSAIMSALSVILIFQLQSQQAAVKEDHSPPISSLLPAGVCAVLLPVSTVLSALSLTLNLSSVVVCLLHGYFSTEVCRGEKDTERYVSTKIFSLHQLRILAYKYRTLLINNNKKKPPSLPHIAYFKPLFYIINYKMITMVSEL